jgi:hypothetical protein
MGNRFPRRQRLAACAGILAAVLAIGVGMGSSFAQDDDEDVPLDTKILRRFMKEMGFKRSEDVGIEYRERAPLVVPPSRDLPPPQAEAPATRGPDWPKDPDVQRRKEASAAEKAKLKRSADAALEESRPLRPDELEKGRGGTAAGAQGNTRPTGEEAARPLPPSQMDGGSKNLLTGFFSSFGPQKAESTPFTGEPPRTSMTAPPPGYQTPSPNQPYGVSPSRKELPKASTVESRMDGTNR